MAGPFELDYLVFVFMAALGVLQMSAAYSSLWGLLFIRLRLLSFLGGLAIVVGAFLWFFISEPRNLSDQQGGLDGNDMAGLFAVGSGTALLLTLLLSSICNLAMAGKGRGYGQGLDALRETTYLHALTATLKVLWKRSGT